MAKWFDANDNLPSARSDVFIYRPSTQLVEIARYSGESERMLTGQLYLKVTNMDGVPLKVRFWTPFEIPKPPPLVNGELRK